VFYIWCGLLALAQAGMITNLKGEKLTEIHHLFWGEGLSLAARAVANGMIHIFGESWD